MRDSGDECVCVMVISLPWTCRGARDRFNKRWFFLLLADRPRKSRRTADPMSWLEVVVRVEGSPSTSATLAQPEQRHLAPSIPQTLTALLRGQTQPDGRFAQLGGELEHEQVALLPGARPGLPRSPARHAVRHSSPGSPGRSSLLLRVGDVVLAWPTRPALREPCHATLQPSILLRDD